MFGYRNHQAKERPPFENTVYNPITAHVPINTHWIFFMLFKLYELLVFSQSDGAIS